MNRRLRVAWVGLGFAGATMLAGAAPAPTVANEPPIELPKFEVVDSRILPPPEPWRYAEVPGFEILSNISVRETRRFAQDFMLLQEVIQAIMPWLNPGRDGVPTALVLAGGGKGMAEFLPAERRGEEYSTNRLFFENAERTAIVMDFALAELRLDASTELEADPYRSFYGEYFRHLIRQRMGPDAPDWLEEGLVQLFAGIDFNRKWIHFAEIGDGFGGNKVGDFNRLLAQRYLMPLGEMFAHSGAQHDTLWSAQCYAFVHMCLYGMDAHNRKPFVEFVTRLGREPLSEELFRQCFHRGYKDVATELRGYLEFTAHKYVSFRAKKGQALPEPPPVVVRDATQAEVGRIKGEVLRLGGHDEQAHLALIAPYVRGETDPRLLAALGLDELTAGHSERAEKFLDVAMQRQVVRPRAYLALAQMRYRAAIATAPERKLTPVQRDHVLAPLMIARQQPPPLLAVYDLIADVWMHSAEPPRREQVLLLAEGVQRFPTDPDLLAACIRLAVRAGLHSDATSLVGRGTKLFGNKPAEKERFALLSDLVTRDAQAQAAQKK